MKKAEVKKGKKKNALKEYWPLYLMMLPALLYLLINNYIPMAGMVIAFKKLNFAKGIWASPWAGLKNFKFRNIIFPFRSDTTAYKYITETSRKKEHHFVLWIVFAITASFLHNKNVINGDIISKVQNMKGKRFGRTIQKISGKNNKR